MGAGRLALVQPLVHDVQRQDLLAAAGEKLENRAQIYLEGSPLGRRAEHEQWDGSRLIAKLAAGLEELGYQVTTGSSNLPAALVALRGRVDEALAFALTGAPSLPAGDRRIDE